MDHMGRSEVVSGLQAGGEWGARVGRREAAQEEEPTGHGAVPPWALLQGSWDGTAGLLGTCPDSVHRVVQGCWRGVTPRLLLIPLQQSVCCLGGDSLSLAGGIMSPPVPTQAVWSSF